MKAFSVSELMRNVERILQKELPVGFSSYLA
jgi:hypothetical protein